MKVTVITVCLNASANITETIESVLGQKGCDYEYIIKDGGSSDETLEIIEKYELQFREKGRELKVFIQIDKGIYDAMNQALVLCGETDYVIFMNAGDKFYNNHVLEDFCKRNSKAEIQIGLTCLKLKKGTIIAQPHINAEIFSFYHQSVFVKTQIMKMYGFNIDYKIAADRDALLKIRKEGYDVTLINMVVSMYDSEGFSTKHMDRMIKESREIDYKYNIRNKPFNKGIWKLRILCYKIVPVLERICAIRNIIKSGDV